MMAAAGASTPAVSQVGCEPGAGGRLTGSVGAQGIGYDYGAP